MNRPLAYILLGSALALSSGRVRAQTAAASSAPPSQPAAPAPSAQNVEEARARFQRALELADDGDFDASLLELRRAYELAPSYKILYNIGLVYQQLKEYARAYDALERYLSEGGASVEPDRAADVRHRIERLAGRVGYLTVTTAPAGAEVLVDDLHVGETPLGKPLRVDSGQRKVTVRLAGRAAENRIVELAGGETRAVSIDLRIAAGPAARPPTSPVPWISWGVTAAVGAATVVTGVLTLNAESSYDKSAGVVGTDLSSSWEKLHTFALTTDVLLALTVVGVGVSTYFTIRPPRVKVGKEAALQILPGAVSGTF